MLTIDVDEGMTAHVGLTGTTINATMNITSTNSDRSIARHVTGITATIDIPGNFNLRPDRRRSQEH